VRVLQEMTSKAPTAGCCCLCSAAAAAAAAGQTDHWLHGEDNACMCASLKSEKQPSLTHLPSSTTLWG